MYAGGQFTGTCSDDACSSIGTPFNHIALWTPGSGGWLSPGIGLNDEVTALVINSHGTLFAGGWFSAICGPSSCITGATRGWTWSNGTARLGLP